MLRDFHANGVESVALLREGGAWGEARRVRTETRNNLAKKAWDGDFNKSANIITDNTRTIHPTHDPLKRSVMFVGIRVLTDTKPFSGRC